MNNEVYIKESAIFLSVMSMVWMLFFDCLCIVQKENNKEDEMKIRAKYLSVESVVELIELHIQLLQIPLPFISLQLNMYIECKLIKLSS